MAYYIKNLTNDNDDIIYPVTRSTAIYLSNNTQLQTFLDGLVDLNIIVSSTEPTTIKSGDFWYDVTT